MSAILHVLAASQALLLVLDLASGDGSVARLLVPLRYPPMRVPSGSSDPSLEADGRLAADFGQVYFPSCAPVPVENAYRRETSVDPWGRPSRYAPLVHRACAATLCRLTYGAASLVHLAVQYALFVASLAYALRRLGLARRLLATILLFHVLVFLTPVGLSFLERGQFTLYVGLAYLWTMLAVTTGRRRHAAAAALFAFVKWTAFPFVAAALVAHALGARTRRELQERAALPAVAAGTALLLFLVMPASGAAFVRDMLAQELTFVPIGITLLHVFPRPLAKLGPLVLVGLIVALARRTSARGGATPPPVLAGAAVVLATYPTCSHDYGVPSLVALVPFLVAWAGRVGQAAPLARAVPGAFAAFLLVASIAMRLLGLEERGAVALYLAIGALLIAAPLLVGAASREADRAALSRDAS